MTARLTVLKRPSRDTQAAVTEVDEVAKRCKQAWFVKYTRDKVFGRPLGIRGRVQAVSIIDPWGTGTQETTLIGLSFRPFGPVIALSRCFYLFFMSFPDLRFLICMCRRGRIHRTRRSSALCRSVKKNATPSSSFQEDRGDE